MKDLSGLQPWLIPYHEYASEWFRQLTGGTVDVRGRKTGGQTPVVTSTYRSFADQQDLYDNREANPYPVNRPGDSAHQWGLAVDSDVSDRQKALWIAVRRAVGFRVPENDDVHGEVPSWRDLVRMAGY